MRAFSQIWVTFLAGPSCVNVSAFIAEQRLAGSSTVLMATPFCWKGWAAVDTAHANGIAVCGFCAQAPPSRPCTRFVSMNPGDCFVSALMAGSL